jgi:hypothetical protein
MWGEIGEEGSFFRNTETGKYGNYSLSSLQRK